MLAALPFDLQTVGSGFAFVVLIATGLAVGRARGLREALKASRENVATLLEARDVDKALLVDERERNRARIATLEAKVTELEATVLGLRGRIVSDLLEAAKTATKEARDAKAARSKRPRRRT